MAITKARCIRPLRALKTAKITQMAIRMAAMPKITRLTEALPVLLARENPAPDTHIIAQSRPYSGRGLRRQGDQTDGGRYFRALRLDGTEGCLEYVADEQRRQPEDW